MERGTILIVDDNLQLLSLLSDLLKPQGYRLLCTTSGADGLALTVAQQPDLVLLDVMLPDMNGFAVCQELRAHPDLAQVPIMMITALDDRDSRMRGFEAGADDFITKPFDYAELCARVAAVLTIDPALAGVRPVLARRSLDIILRELFVNARKFHPARAPQLQLTAALSQPDQVTLRICDDGIYLTPEQLRRVWQPYYQAEKSFTGQLEGMGLGLLLIARNVHAVNGSVAIANRTDGPGLCVSITLPMRV
jgi:DNA-binding response OmpR family regulator